MKITFVSNYLNHHQYPLCEALINLKDIIFTFVATMPIRKERITLGYRDMNHEPFVIRAYENKEQEALAEQICAESDLVICGSAPHKYVEIAVAHQRLLFRYSERIFKNGPIYAFSPKAILNMWKLHGKYQKKNVYLLCASAYSALDFNRMGAYKNKAYRWGYFPEVKKYNDISQLLDSKIPNSLLWVGRFIDCKCPEIPIEIARRLKANGYHFTLKMIGNGDLLESMTALVQQYDLQDYVSLMGSLSPEEVRLNMEQSDIFLFTSNFQEGWGAVLNESMNSACAVLASHAIGSAPFLIENGENGMLYSNGDLNSLYRKTCYLLNHSEKRRTMQYKAYETMVSCWSPEVAAERLVRLAQELMKHESCDVFESGPCSKAPRLRNQWFKEE